VLTFTNVEFDVREISRTKDISYRGGRRREVRIIGVEGHIFLEFRQHRHLRHASSGIATRNKDLESTKHRAHIKTKRNELVMSGKTEGEKKEGEKSSTESLRNLCPSLRFISRSRAVHDGVHSRSRFFFFRHNSSKRQRLIF